MSSLTIRSATPGDAAALARLAALDSRRAPAAPQLLALDGHDLVAAISVADGSAIADPFTHSADAVELLRRRVAQLGARPAARRHRPRLGHGLRLAGR